MFKGDAESGRLRSKRPSWEYRVIFAASYPIFLLSEVVDRARRALRLAPPRTRENKSVFAAAKQAADTSLPYAFMG
jgi:hypothetical protein